MPIPATQLADITLERFPLLSAQLGTQEALRNWLAKSPFNSLAEADYFFDDITGFIHLGYEAITDLPFEQQGLKAELLATLTAEANPDKLTRLFIRAQAAGALLDTDAIRCLHRLLHNLPEADTRHPERDALPCLQLHLELSPGNPYQYHADEQTRQLVPAAYATAIQTAFKQLFKRIAGREYLTAVKLTISQLETDYIAGKRAKGKTPSPARCQSLQRLNFVCHSLGRGGHHPTMRVALAINHYLDLYQQAIRQHTTAVRLRAHRLMPATYLLIESRLQQLRQWTSPVATPAAEAKAFAELSVASNFTDYPRRIEAPDLHICDRTAAEKAQTEAEAALARAQAERQARLQLRRWFNHQAQDKLRRRNIQQAINTLQQAARDDANPMAVAGDGLSQQARRARNRARQLVAAENLLTLQPLISISDADATIHCPQQQICFADLQGHFYINGLSGRCYTKANFARLETTIRRDPHTRSPLQRLAINPGNFDINELNRLLNLARLSQPIFIQKLAAQWANAEAIDALSRLHPNYLCSDGIQLLNCLRPEQLSAALCTRLNHFAAHHDAATCRDLIRHCLIKTVNLNRLSQLPLVYIRRDALALLNRLRPEQLSDALMTHLNRLAESHCIASCLALISHCLDHHISLDHLAALSVADIQLLAERNDDPRVLLPERMAQLDTRAQRKVTHYQGALQGCAGFWRSDHKTRRLQHYRNLHTALAPFIAAPAARR